MRKLVWLLLVVGVLWCAWWAAAATSVQTATTTWLDGRRALGWQVDLTQIERRGFPLSLHSHLEGLHLSDPTQGLALTAPTLDLSAPAWWPGFAALRLPELTVQLPGAAGPLSIIATDIAADLRIHPGLALELQSAQVSAANLHLEGASGPWLHAKELLITVQQDSDDPARYRLSAQPQRVTPAVEFRRLLALGENWPQDLSAVSAYLDVQFDRPLDRHMQLRNTPMPRAITLSDTELIWGDVKITADGTLDVDATGLLQGQITLNVTDWPSLLDLVARAGLLPDGLRTQSEIMLQALANQSGSEDTLDLTLAFNDGFMALGDIPLGPAPRLFAQ